MADAKQAVWEQVEAIEGFFKAQGHKIIDCDHHCGAGENVASMAFETLDGETFVIIVKDVSNG